MVFAVISLSVAIGIMGGIIAHQWKSNRSMLAEVKAQHEQCNVEKQADFARRIVESERVAKERLADVERVFNQRMSDMREQYERMIVLAEQKGSEAGEKRTLKNLQFRGFSADEEVDVLHFWQKKVRRTLAVVLLEGKPIHVWGDLHKLNVFNIPDEFKKALNLMISTAVNAVTGMPVHIGALC